MNRGCVVLNLLLHLQQKIAMVRFRIKRPVACFTDGEPATGNPKCNYGRSGCVARMRRLTPPN